MKENNKMKISLKGMKKKLFSFLQSNIAARATSVPFYSHLESERERCMYAEKTRDFNFHSFIHSTILLKKEKLVFTSVSLSGFQALFVLCALFPLFHLFNFFFFVLKCTRGQKERGKFQIFFSLLHQLLLPFFYRNIHIIFCIIIKGSHSEVINQSDIIICMEVILILFRSQFSIFFP